MFDIGKVTNEWCKTEKFSVEYIDNCVSTNLLAKNRDLNEFTSDSGLFLTSHQTEGRGRGSNSWTSPPNEGGLLSSWVYKLEDSPQPIATPLFGWAVYRALMDEFDIPLSLKAPNDLYLEDKKLGGILLEAITQGDEHWLIVGVGLNIFSHPDSEKESSDLKSFIAHELEENRWIRILANLRALMNQAAQASTLKTIPEIYRADILKALKAWPGSKVEQVHPDGSLDIEGGLQVHWSNL